MDFRFSEEQIAIRELAREILERETAPERLKQAEAAGEFFDRETWQRLAEANLLGLAVPEELGGMGLGELELVLLLQEVGRTLAPLPALPTLVLAGLPIAHFGSELQRKEWLSPLARGELVLSGAFAPGQPLRVLESAAGFALEGQLHQVPAAGVAERVLVPARPEGGEPALFLVDPRAQGVALEARRSSRGEPLFEMALSAVEVAESEVLFGAQLVEWTTQRLLTGCAALQLGVCERALEITTDYLREREQFGAPLGALPAVQHRCADAYIALDALRGVTWRAAWRLSAGRSAARDARVAKFWAADAGSRITTATQHLHGGMGVDLDYPIHRYFLWAKALELAYGGATAQLLALGDDLAEALPEEPA